MFLGIDPDLHTLAYCYLGIHGGVCRIFRLGVVRVPDEHKRREAVVPMIQALSRFHRQSVGFGYDLDALIVESQEIVYSAKQGANPRDMVNLSQVAGAAAAGFFYKTLFMPLPQEWKGSVPKPIHQARVLRRIGCEVDQLSDHSRPGSLPMGGKPEGWDDLKRDDWPHVVDAIGLALWGYDKQMGKPVRVRQ